LQQGARNCKRSFQGVCRAYRKRRALWRRHRAYQ
jgi:hypothetical protein